MSKINASDKLPIIQSLWIGGNLSTMERLSIASFLKNGHEVHLYTYDDVENIPKGTNVHDANTIISSERIFKYKREDSYAGFSNVFRYKLLYEKGNYWVDLDVVCLKPFNLIQDYVFSGVKKRRLLGLGTAKTFIQSCVIKTPPGSEIMKYCYEVSNNKNPKELVWGEIGPNLLQSAVIKFEMDKYISSSGAFTTNDWPHWHRFISGSLARFWIEWIKIITYSSYGIHLYNEMWHQNQTDKNGSFPKNSIYEWLKRRYLFSANNISLLNSDN